MKIAPIIPYYTNFNFNNKVKNSNPNRNNIQYSTNNFVYPPVYFKGVNLTKAQAYLDSVIPKKGFNRRLQEIYDLDLDKLDGIQEGIEVFKGLNIKEIAFIARTLFSVNTNRGCYNMCSHCYANAMPPVKESENVINKMSWEDFESLTNGFKELNSRLRFYISAPKLGGFNRGERYITAFHDADCMTLNLVDAEGKQHDFIDISNALSESTGFRGIFDTTGWTPTDRRMQERAEKFAKYYSRPENRDKLFQFNISINPFHSLYTKSIEEKRAGNLERAKKFRRLYIDRIANAIYTFTPLINTRSFSFILRGFDRGDIGKLGEGFTMEDLYKLNQEILIKLQTKYLDDLAGERKYIKAKRRINYYLGVLNYIMDRQYSDGVILVDKTRLLKNVGKDNNYYQSSMEQVKKDIDTIKSSSVPTDFIDKQMAGIVDSNGDYYITTYYTTFPTELKLNFKNKNKQTPPIRPSLQEDLIISRDVINNV